ncbi:MAG: NAD+ synthase, partial [Thermoleophilia bacterium]|nr:NAD+ synthase [Thermoleophilia bacterium]
DHFLRACHAALEQVAADCEGIAAVVGLPLLKEGSVYNAAAVLAEGRVAGAYHKIWLPNYGVFDEKRYFAPGDKVLVLQLGDARVGLNICEDIWDKCGPTEEAALRGGADVVVNLSMSPYHVGKGRERQDMLARRATDAGCYVCYLNGVGGQDELVFDGQSLVIAPDGHLLARAGQFVEELVVVDLDIERARQTVGQGCAPGLWPVNTLELPEPPPASGAGDVRPIVSPPLPLEAEVYQALCLG